MSIRNAAKAIILHDNKILLNRCHSSEIGDYYSLPGGGQHLYETMEEAIVRECMEETGYAVVPESFVALYEEIYTCVSVRTQYPDSAHKIFHIFRCGLANEEKAAPTEQDSGQLDCVWVDIDDITAINFIPNCIGDNIQILLYLETPLYLGSHFIDFEKTV